MPNKRKVNDETGRDSSKRRNCSKPARYNDADFEKEKKDTHFMQSNLLALTTTLKSWSESSLTLLSHTIQWDIDLSTEEIAAIVGKSPNEVGNLLKLIKFTRWEEKGMKKTLGESFFLPKDSEHSASENLLDFWRAMCTMLTPTDLNNTSEIAAVMKEIAGSSDKDFRPIYEYIATALDDPVSTLKSHPDLTPLQCGMVLEILYSLATEAKKHDHLKDYLHERALAAMLGDWDLLKMPEPEKVTDQRTLAKRISLQSLNPFNMSKVSLPPVVFDMPSNAIPDPPTTRNVPVTAELRTMAEMVKVDTGFKTFVVKTNQPEGDRNSNFKKRKYERKTKDSIDFGHSVQIENVASPGREEEEEEED